MQYVCIVFVLIILILSAYLFFQRKALSTTLQQMEEIEQHPERNRQLKAFTTNPRIEELLNQINYIYQARQQERIIYQPLN